MQQDTVMFKRRQKAPEKGICSDNPDRLALFRLLCDELDSDLINEMAAYDGGMDVESNREALVEILRTGNVPCPLPPDPAEICNLMRWDTIDLNTLLTPEIRRQRIMHLFASWILINAYAHPIELRNGYTDDGDELALYKLTATSVSLGPEYARAAMRLVTWAKAAGPDAHDPIENLFYHLSHLVLRCASGSTEDFSVIPELYDALVAEEQHLHLAMNAPGNEKSQWLFGLYDGFCDGSEGSDTIERKWTTTILWVLNHLPATVPDHAAPKLQELKKRLEDNMRNIANGSVPRFRNRSSYIPIPLLLTPNGSETNFYASLSLFWMGVSLFAWACETSTFARVIITLIQIALPIKALKAWRQERRLKSQSTVPPPSDNPQRVFMRVAGALENMINADFAGHTSLNFLLSTA